MLPSRIYSRSRTRVLPVALLSLLALAVLAPAAPAAGPASVTVEVEGLSETKVPAAQVTTTATAVVKNNGEGHPEGSCSGTSALGALQLATAGNWTGPWNSKFSQYEIYSIMGETHEFEPGASANYYWSFWLNHQEASTGACEAELQQGDRVLFFPACYSESVPSACPAPPTPLGIEAPTSANAGEAVTVTVSQYNSKGEAAPAVGANVAGGGVSASTDFQGHATMRFSGDGTYTLHANGSSEGPPAVRSETSICVHEGNDGTCGTTSPGGSSPLQAAGPAGHPYTGIFALVARSTAFSEGHVYSRGSAPRLLTGSVIAHSAVTSISISLRRSFNGRCFTYNATRERFLKARCGRDGFFKVAGGGTSFSYLLPAKLAPGRYVFDIASTDAAGNRAALARGSTRTVFYVR